MAFFSVMEVGDEIKQKGIPNTLTTPPWGLYIPINPFGSLTDSRTSFSG